METGNRDLLMDIERRLTDLEKRQSRAGGEDGRMEPWQFLAIIVPVAVFAWLSGGSVWAWLAVGFIGVAAVVAATLVTLRRG